MSLKTPAFLYNTYLRAQLPGLPSLTEKIVVDDHESLRRLADRFIQAACYSGGLDVEGLVTAADEEGSRSVDYIAS